MNLKYEKRGLELFSSYPSPDWSRNIRERYTILEAHDVSTATSTSENTDYRDRNNRPYHQIIRVGHVVPHAQQVQTHALVVLLVHVRELQQFLKGLYFAFCPRGGKGGKEGRSLRKRNHHETAKIVGEGRLFTQQAITPLQKGDMKCSLKFFSIPK